ncbi:MAG: indolepyruvate oxidoreductase subunit beta [Candidatus Thermoplasmatota archaeon]|nr:indolepyruvate ferredoxin oxidoreductase subunit beta [Euryarchaeota archaeon]MBU4032067.1 indolepyruvate oxidoreductase subunit beta [Candidatus Thermoplasmatota archaeon]MBU4071734.1 indolepyruvate oxidoreductase subunit beta [Candidatus Thermoplasmatota archaeon]MBU4144596.1 indolepyruvate oxidoreductase subunit beta [Candidatus Thermoplasmatota archaeon]MBU4592145.1 indolepyruvate oxidoreductase subunit beta [Candidatus Thermoplasmatota archaeon]
MTRIVVVGVGGQGVLFASKVLSEAALMEGKNAVMSEVHGMAQRGGVVMCNICVGCIESSLVGDAEADIIFAFEPMEAYRALPKANAGTRFVTSTSKVVPVVVSIGKQKYPDVEGLFNEIRAITPKLTAVDADALANQAGSYVTANSVLLGALAGTAECPVSVEILKEALKNTVPPKTLEINMKAFELGLAAAKLG